MHQELAVQGGTELFADRVVRTSPYLGTATIKGFIVYLFFRLFVLFAHLFSFVDDHLGQQNNAWRLNQTPFPKLI